eukprot:gene35266-58188_t
MSATMPRVYRGKPTLQAELLTWLPVMLGLAVLYLPSLYDLFTGIWAQDEQMHGPIVLGISCWLIYRTWPDMLAASHGEQPSAWGWAFFVIGLLLLWDQPVQPVRVALNLVVGCIGGTTLLLARWRRWTLATHLL